MDFPTKNFGNFSLVDITWKQNKLGNMITPLNLEKSPLISDVLKFTVMFPD